MILLDDYFECVSDQPRWPCRRTEQVDNIEAEVGNDREDERENHKGDW